jgi:hypothetical protein
MNERTTRDVTFWGFDFLNARDGLRAVHKEALVEECRNGRNACIVGQL